MDGLQFFQKSAGQWYSLRTTHHLPFRRAETGGSDITVKSLGAEDHRIAEICQMHSVDPSNAVGGAFVSWDGAMEWDKEGEDHSGTSVFSLVPDQENPQQGKLLRERGYAEVVPVMGEYHIDQEDALVLITEYDTMSINERFWFPHPSLRLRTSTVKRFGGLSTATFCAEIRVDNTDGATSETTDQDGVQSFWGW
ncbi:phycobiliprotein lyase [Dactylococcopsis salina]|uniref:Chromophore lyase CpcS/CpeS n=1 Tax=Dactylococcopsis salina (strain PCC 8305) TaxID=13035 RepID=K9YT93_DACS8|nr:phycobiliprotein lyase [Dactylococcopsis salina]AFZ49323.1 CpeS-like protein [Dactylococcopsis salina PCC 8305]